MERRRKAFAFESICFEVKSKAEYLPLVNTNTVSFAGETLEIGINGACSAHLVDPFWDNYDTKLFDSDPFGGKTQVTLPGVWGTRARFNNFVNIDREYIDKGFENLEDILSGKTDIPCKKIVLHGDIFNPDEFIGYKGKGGACVYLVLDFVVGTSVESGDYNLGNCAPFKAWENGRMISESHEFLPLGAL